MRSMNEPVRRVRRAGAVLLSSALVAALPVAAATAAPAQPSGDLSCSTGTHANDELTGFALCQNIGSTPVEFQVQLVCGWAPDAAGEWVRLEPGASGQSTAHCPFYSSGIGEINIGTR